MSSYRSPQFAPGSMRGSQNSFLREMAQSHEALSLRNRAEADQGTPIPYEEKKPLFKLLGFKPVPRQEAISSDEHRFRVIKAGRRAGKTTLAAAEGVAQLLLRPGSLVLVIGPFTSQAERLFDMVLDHLDRACAHYGVEIIERQTYRLNVRLSNGSELVGRGGEYPDSCRGLPVDLAIVDEAALVSDILWDEVLRPAVADRRGRAIFISTPFLGSWFERLYNRERERLRRLALAENLPEDQIEAYLDRTLEWSFASYPMWENTAKFPGGADDPEIRNLRRSMDADKFLQEVAAVSMPSLELVYPQFRADVHVRRVPVNETLPVQLGIDPSTGVNTYAVTAFQDLKTRVHQVGEFGQKGVLAEEVIEACSRMKWWPRVDFAVMDSAAIYDLRIWQQHPLVKFDVVSVKKPKVEERFAVIREWLLDPAEYDELLMGSRKAVMVEHGYQGRWEDLAPEDKAEIEVYARSAIEAKDLAKCSRFFVDHSCVGTVDEYLRYKYQRRKDSSLNFPERPRDADDHFVDASGYWFWMVKRYDAVDRVVDREREPYAFDVEGKKVGGLLVKSAIPDAVRQNAFVRE